MRIPDVVVQDFSHQVEYINYYSDSCKKDYFDTWAEVLKKWVHPHSCNVVNPAHPETKQKKQALTLTALFYKSNLACRLSYCNPKSNYLEGLQVAAELEHVDDIHPEQTSQMMKRRLISHILTALLSIYYEQLASFHF